MARLNNRFSLKGDEFIKLMKAHSDALESSKKTAIIDPKKKITIDDGRFAYDDRKRAGWYPRDSNLPEGFDGMVRTFTFEAIGKFPIFDPNSKADVSKVTSDVCMELDQMWRPEWGKRPAGKYVRADVEDALEDLI